MLAPEEEEVGAQGWDVSVVVEVVVVAAAAAIVPLVAVDPGTYILSHHLYLNTNTYSTMFKCKKD